MFEVQYNDINNFDLHKILLERGLIVIRNACLEVDDFEELTNKMGKSLVTTKHVLNKARTIQELSNKGLFSNGDVGWHNDWSYGRGNYFGTILHNVKNGHLSPTWFCDTSNAPNDLKNIYKNSIGKYYPPADLHNLCFTEKQLALLKKQKITRPFITNHHITGEEILYCSINTIQENKVDLKPFESWIEENAYMHNWQDNDVLIWDNLKMIHKRVAFEGERLLWRTQFII